MSLLGTVIKKGLEWNQLLLDSPIDAVPAQREQLKSLLSTAKDTAIGKYYDYAGILDSKNPEEVFRKRVPLVDYHQMHSRWWRQQERYPDITWPGHPDFFALSSGTTGKKSKRIPITADFIESMRDVGKSMVRALPDYNLPETLYESEILMLSSSADLRESKHGYRMGEISGINVSNFPGWYDMFYRPGKEIAAIDDWDERCAAIVKKAPEWDIGAICGIPSWVLLLLRSIITEHRLETIHDIWPSLEVYASGGVAFETFRADFDAVTARPLIIMDTYLASEGFFAYTTSPDRMDMRLALVHGYYYEFIPFDERGVDETGQILDEPMCVSIGDVKQDQDYVLVVSSCSGAWRYIIGDTIRFTSIDPHDIVITGRTKFFLNVVGSQLSEEKLDTGILATSENFNVSINEYMVAAMQDETGEYLHHWIVVTDDHIEDEVAFAKMLDETLQQSNKNYSVARSKALKKVIVRAITKEQYYDYLDGQKKKGGQVKTPKVMTEDKMRALMETLNA